MHFSSTKTSIETKKSSSFLCKNLQDILLQITSKAKLVKQPFHQKSYWVETNFDPFSYVYGALPGAHHSTKISAFSTTKYLLKGYRRSIQDCNICLVKLDKVGGSSLGKGQSGGFLRLVPFDRALFLKGPHCRLMVNHGLQSSYRPRILTDDHKIKNHT